MFPAILALASLAGYRVIVDKIKFLGGPTGSSCGATGLDHGHICRTISIQLERIDGLGLGRPEPGHGTHAGHSGSSVNGLQLPSTRTVLYTDIRKVEEPEAATADSGSGGRGAVRAGYVPARLRVGARPNARYISPV